MKGRKVSARTWRRTLDPLVLLGCHCNAFGRLRNVYDKADPSRIAQSNQLSLVPSPATTAQVDRTVEHGKGRSDTP